MRWGTVQGIWIVFFIIFFTGNVGMAQIVETKGYGENKEAAIRDAMRIAVEKVVGTFIDSKTLVSQAVVIQDDIYSKAHGFITNIDVIEEGKDNGMYYVQANVDVNTNPDSQLRDRLQMIMLLDNPKIGVIINYYNDTDVYKKEKYPIMCENSMNSKLANLGFTHLVASNVVLQNKGIDRTDTLKGTDLLPNTGLDYLVVGKLELSTNNIILPKYSEYSIEDNDNKFVTNLLTSLAELDITVLKADTGEIIDSYRVEAKSIRNSQNSAENEAINQVALLASEKLEQVFSKKAADTDRGLQIIARVDSYDTLLILEDELKQIAGVRSVKVKTFNSEKGYIDIDTELNLPNIFRKLKDKSKLNLFIERITNNSLEISVG